jgi:hypothetical protein
VILQETPDAIALGKVGKVSGDLRFMVKKYFGSVILSKNNGTYCSMRDRDAKTGDI